jgi:hypothetical protein
MVNRDYRKEVGIASSKKSVPKVVAIIVLAAVAVVITFSVTRVLAEAKKHDEKASAAGPATPAD